MFACLVRRRIQNCWLPNFLFGLRLFTPFHVLFNVKKLTDFLRFLDGGIKMSYSQGNFRKYHVNRCAAEEDVRLTVLPEAVWKDKVALDIGVIVLFCCLFMDADFVYQVAIVETCFSKSGRDLGHLP